MGTLTDEDAVKLSRTELRKQKLAEYLAAKGKLKPPNPRPYLKDSAHLKKTQEVMQQFQSSGKGKENSARNATDVKKDVKMGDALTEKHTNITTSKRELRSLFKAPSGSNPVLKPTMSQTATQHYRTHSELTSMVRNVSIKEQKIKPALQTGVRASKQFKHLKTGQQPMCGQAETSSRASSFRGEMGIAKTGMPKVVTGKEFGSSKMISGSRITFPVSRLLQDKGPVRTESKAVTNTHINLADKACRDDTRVKRNQTRNSQTEKVRSQSNPKEPLSQSNKPANKSSLPASQRNAPTATATRPRSALYSAVSKTANVSTRASATTTGNKKALPQRQCTTVKLPPKSTAQVSVPQSLPHHSKSSSQAKGSVQLKTPKSTFNPGTQGVRTVPLDGTKKQNAAQEERMRKLQEWRESRGITYKRPPMPVKPVRRKTTAAYPQSYWATMEKEDEVHGFVCVVDQSLNDCIKLLEQGCPVDQIRDVLSRVPMAQKFSKYWICQVRLMEREGNLNVLPTFEEAIRVVREPVDELRAVVFEILKKKEAKGSASPCIEEGKEVDSEGEGKRQCDMHTPKPVGALIRGARGNSSVIKYKITTTPGGKRSHQREKSGRVNGQELRFFTPVRRSLRIEKTAPRYPAALQEHDPCVTSLPDLLTDGECDVGSKCATENKDSPLYVYRENEALKDHVAIELVYE
ncbi:cytoskeleton-associated protein 2-like [Salminus brasiliensis]|uniref:cytoskeleton-associated protein 2-like n=1 Tax=Salminus brasiliensis TaxID=930266 RepID=UPI003B8319B9